MIEPVEGYGVSRAKASCDECSRSEVVPANHGSEKSGKYNINEGQVKRKLCAQGWSDVKGKLRCPSCEAKRKISNHKEANMATKQEPKSASVVPMREPTKEQKREIVAMLQITYDTDAGRYKSGDTDKTVAEAIGGGVMWGWVAEIRDDLFGPDGTNDDVAKLLDEVAAIRDANTKDAKNLRIHLEEAEGIMRMMTERTSTIADMEKRCSAIVNNFGPKAQRA
jgi:rubredoxin